MAQERTILARLSTLPNWPGPISSMECRSCSGMTTSSAIWSCRSGKPGKSADDRHRFWSAAASQVARMRFGAGPASPVVPASRPEALFLRDEPEPGCQQHPLGLLRGLKRRNPAQLGDAPHAALQRLDRQPAVWPRTLNPSANSAQSSTACPFAIGSWGCRSFSPRPSKARHSFSVLFQVAGERPLA